MHSAFTYGLLCLRLCLLFSPCDSSFYYPPSFTGRTKEKIIKEWIKKKEIHPLRAVSLNQSSVLLSLYEAYFNFSVYSFSTGFFFFLFSLVFLVDVFLLICVFLAFLFGFRFRSNVIQRHPTGQPESSRWIDELFNILWFFVACEWWAREPCSWLAECAQLAEELGKVSKMQVPTAASWDDLLNSCTKLPKLCTPTRIYCSIITLFARDNWMLLDLSPLSAGSLLFPRTGRRPTITYMYIRIPIGIDGDYYIVQA